MQDGTGAARSYGIAARGEIAGRLGRIVARLRRGPREPGRLLSVPLLLLAGTGALAALLLLPFDEAIAYGVRDEPSGVRAFLEILTDVGLIAWYFYPGLALTLGLLVLSVRPASCRFRARWHRLGIHAAYLTASLGLATTITHSLKYAIGRARPERLDELGPFDTAFLRLGSAYESFPSGHSTNVGVLAIVLAVWFPPLRWPLLVTGLCLGLTRIAVEAHFASDVAAGLTIGALTALTLARWLALRRIVYRVEDDGAGWAGLMPRRPGRF